MEYNDSEITCQGKTTEL